MGDERSIPNTQDAKLIDRVRWRPTLAILAFLVALLAALALTYGWPALTGGAGAPNPPFAVRAALSAVLIFLGVFALTGLWLPPLTAISVPEASAPPALASSPESGEGEITPDTDLLPIHQPVRAADLPRILFDTNELPAISARPKKAHQTGGRAIHPPLPEPHETASDE